MISKSKLINIIEKSCLNVDDTKIIFKSFEEQQTVHNIITKTSTCRAVITAKNIGVPDSVIPIPDYKQLINILKCLDENIEIRVDKTSLKLSDSGSDVLYGLGDSKVFTDWETERPLKKLPPKNVEFPLNKEFIDRFKNARSALSATVVGISTHGQMVDFVLGYSPSQNKNRISISIDTENPIDNGIFDVITFDADMISTIMNVNKDFVESTFEMHCTDTASCIVLKFFGDYWESSYIIPNINIS